MNSKVDVWENEVYLALKWREKIAYRIAFACLLVAAISVAGWATYWNLRSVEYVVVTVDRQTGDADITSIVNTINVSSDQVLAEAFVYKYVTMREVYDHWDQKRRINDVWSIFTTGRAKKEIYTLYGDDNPQNPIEKYGTATKIEVRIKSIVLTEGDSAQVRLEKVFTTGQEVRTRNYVVTMKYFSDLQREATKDFRRKNPIAYFVTEYRIDPEAN